jgi:outer membrane protein TolC
MKSLIFLIAALAAPLTLDAQQLSTDPPTIVSLEDALAIAEQSAPAMRNTATSLRNAKQGVTRSYAAFLPTVSTNASLRPAQNGGRANYSAGINMGLSGLFSQDSYFAIGLAKRSLATAEATAVTQLFTLRAQVKSQYFAVLQAQEQLTASRNQLAITEKQLEISRVRVRSGMVVVNDSLSAANSVLSAQINLLTAENNVNNTIRTFSRTLGIETLVQPDARDTANFRVIQLDSAALVSMLLDAPALNTLRANMATARHNVRVARLQYVPRISGGLNWGRSGSGQGVWGYGDKAYNYSGGEPSISFSMSLTVFSGFQREFGLVNAKETLANQELNYRDQVLTQQSDLINRINSIRVLEKNLELQAKSIIVAEDNHRWMEKRYELDLVTDIEVLNTRNALFNANNSLINMRTQYRNQIAQLEQMLGRELR